MVFTLRTLLGIGKKESPRKKNRLFKQTQLNFDALEQRLTPAAIVWANDNWVEQFNTSGGTPGVVEAGDTVANTGPGDNGLVTGKIFGLDAFATIQGAVGAVDTAGTVNVLAGTYLETVTIDKSLQLLGAQAGVTPVAGTRAGGESIISGIGGFGVIITANDVEMNGFELTGQNFSISTNNNGTGGAWHDVDIQYNYVHNTGVDGIVLGFNVNGPGPTTFTNYTLSHNRIVGGTEAAINAPASPATYTNLTISDNDLSNSGVFTGGNPATAVFTGAVIANNEIHHTGDAGMNIAAAGNTSIRDNYFHHIPYTGFQASIVGGEVLRNRFENITGTVNGTGDAFQLYGGQFGTQVSANVDVANNVINFNTDAVNPVRGIRLRPPASGVPTAGQGIDGTTIHIHNNTFINGGLNGVGAFAILNQGDTTKAADASSNYWSTTSETAVAALMSGSVDFTPYLGFSTDTEATNGFQGNFSLLLVTTLGSQITGPRIQEGIDSVNNAGAVVIGPGTYSGNVDTTAAGRNITLAPGVFLGQLTINGNLALNSGDTIAIDIGGTNAASQFDNFQVNGAVTLGNAGLTVNLLNFSPTAGQQFTILNKLTAGAVSGVFAGLGEGSIVQSGGQSFRVSFVGGNGNDVVLTSVAASTGSFVYIDFGANGFWRWSATTGFQLIHSANVETFSVGINGFVYIDFGVYGLWRWSEGTGFLQIHAANAEDVVAGPDGFAYVDFGNNGFWRWSQATGFQAIHAANVEGFTVGADGFVTIDFGSFGLWRWSQATTFQQIHAANPERIEASGDGFVYVDFGNNGFWRWSQATGFQAIHTANVEGFAVGADGFVTIDFGSLGLWRWSQATAFRQIHPNNVDEVVAGSNGVIFVDFGSFGLWRWSSATGFLQIHSVSPERIRA